MIREIMVYAEQYNGHLSDVACELLGKARCLIDGCGKGGAKVSAVLIGDGVLRLADELIFYGADRVYVSDSPKLKYYSNETFSKIITDVISKHEPDIFLVGATAEGTELAPTVGGRLKTGVAAHCVELKLSDDGLLIQVVPSFGGKVMGEILCPNHRPQIASIKPGVFEKQPKDSDRQGEVIHIDADELFYGFKPRITPLGVHYQPPSGRTLDTADVVVAGGWGMGNKQNWRMLEQLADALGAAVGCTRPAVDEGWAEGEHMMVGTSGKTIKPKVYLAIGISGATHHVCGMKDAGIIISINNDPKAPIFNVSDFKIVADLEEILSVLLKKING
jgi:electron transfer flavoprotein alpha subunit